MSALKNEIGNVYGKLIVFKRAPNKNHRAAWWIRCICGTEKIVSANVLRAGRAISCGCERRGRTPSPLTSPKVLAQRRAYYQSLKDLPYA